MVDFTCTRTKCPSCSTAKSSRAVSPHGLVTHSPCSAAHVIKRSSAHSPRSLGCLIFIPLFFIDIGNRNHPSIKKAASRGRALFSQTSHYDMRQTAKEHSTIEKHLPCPQFGNLVIGEFVDVWCGRPRPRPSFISVIPRRLYSREESAFPIRDVGASVRARTKRQNQKPRASSADGP